MAANPNQILVYAQVLPEEKTLTPNELRDLVEACMIDLSLVSEADKDKQEKRSEIIPFYVDSDSLKNFLNKEFTGKRTPTIPSLLQKIMRYRW
jgi:hypothetical protein